MNTSPAQASEQNNHTLETPYIMHGMLCSYFTKKLEVYFQIKGIPYQMVETDGPDFTQCGLEVGVTQIPQVQQADGRWLTDTSLIMEHFEANPSLPAIRPTDPVAAFCSDFLEDCFDEWYWAPAMYYRWAFKMDRIRRSEEFSYTVLANGMPLPRWLGKKNIEHRQIDVHLKGNGITSPEHARVIEDLYIDTLDLLQTSLQKRPFLFGERPCEADVGMFGPFFPHFACDPTPQEIMHVRAPHLVRWLGRMWSTRPEEVTAAKPVTEVPADLQPLLTKMADEYLPYLVANQQALQAGQAETQYQHKGLNWVVATAPYRLYCLQRLQKSYQDLNQEQQSQVQQLLGDNAHKILGAALEWSEEIEAASAFKPLQSCMESPLSRHWDDKMSLGDRINAWFCLRRKSKSKPETKQPGSSWLPIYFQRYRAKAN